ncbi:unnamed protein product [Rotaria sp. Silwood2]|nr:unnamed protein product [Rotaria sp. Silwood2]CAF3241575.1 unnamed protein product [Rotaria sp. Silwood2]CAF4158404.1 unnamed protein product [Rotaria sp. Silwood2]CAF4204596.1 unnamed protein product [Rotaria sp. Silwood2]
MLNILCDQHYNHVVNKLTTEFEQRISRAKEEVQQNIANASTAEQHGQALIKQIWAMIENDVQKQCQNRFERFFATWDQYHPSIIAANCVYELFRSIDYQSIFKYIKDPVDYVKNWLRSKFDERYEIELTNTLNHLSSDLSNEKKKFQRMILTWHEAVQSFADLQSVADLIDCLKTFLINGEYTKNKLLLRESQGSFPFLDSTTIRTIPTTADRHRLLKAISSMSQELSVDDVRSRELTQRLINNDQFKNRLFVEFHNRSKGCGTPCPYCKQMCDNDNQMHTEHRCENHLLWVFQGYRNINTGKPSLKCCTSNAAFESNVEIPTEKDTFVPFTEHKSRFHPTWNIINLKTSLDDHLLRAYIALEEDLAEYYNFKGRADIAIKKNFLRTTVTVHCYALLIGIDYEGTSNSLKGIPSHDVSCIKNQLMDSSMAYPEKLHMLINTEATKARILNELQSIVNNMDERSTFIFYFSGHGGLTTLNQSYLLTGDEKQLYATELAKIINKAKTNKIILILDSCYSGGMGKPFIPHLMNPKQGIHILCSSHDSQVSYQDDTNGFFTKYLIKGLRGEYTCETMNCNECATRVTNLQKAEIRKVTSTELTTYLSHAVTGCQNFAYTTIQGCNFDVSFID